MFKKIILLLTLTTFLGCFGGNSDAPPKWDSPTIETSTTTQTYSTESPGVDSTIQTENSPASSGNFTLQASKVNSINPVQVFNYSNPSIPNSTVEFRFSGDEQKLSFSVKLNENNFTWESNYNATGPLKSIWSINGMTYTGQVVQGLREYGLTLEIDNNNQLQKIVIGHRSFTKVAERKATSSKLKYLDDHQVEVQRGQTLRILVDLYNEDPANLVKVTVTEICQKNNLGSKCGVHVGQVVKFN